MLPTLKMGYDCVVSNSVTGDKVLERGFPVGWGLPVTGSNLIISLHPHGLDHGTGDLAIDVGYFVQDFLPRSLSILSTFLLKNLSTVAWARGSFFRDQFILLTPSSIRIAHW